MGADADSSDSTPILSKSGRASRSKQTPALGPWSKGMARFKLLRLKKWRGLPMSQLTSRLSLLSSILAQSSSGRDQARLLLENLGSSSRAAGVSQMRIQGPTVIQGKPYHL